MESLKAILKQYILYDRQVRRSLLGFIVIFWLEVIVLVLLAVSAAGKWPAMFAFIVSTGLLFGTSLSAPMLLAAVIRRQKAERSFLLLRALPLRAETLFWGTVLAGVTASILACLPLYVMAAIGLILLDGGVGYILLVGWGALLLSFCSACVTLAVALCVNNPAVITNVIAGAIFLITTLILIQNRFDIIRVSEEELLRSLRFVLSFEGYIVMSAIVIGFSVLTGYIGSQIFSRKKSYV